MALSLKSSFIPSLNPSKSSAKSSQKHKQQNNGRLGFSRWSCRKQGIHPAVYDDAKVYCNGELVMTTGGTQKEYNVDVWSGNHPFYLGSRSGLADTDQVEKFRKRFGELKDLMEIPVLRGEIVLPTKKKSASGKGKGKK